MPKGRESSTGQLATGLIFMIYCTLNSSSVSKMTCQRMYLQIFRMCGTSCKLLLWNLLAKEN